MPRHPVPRAVPRPGRIPSPPSGDPAPRRAGRALRTKAWGRKRSACARSTACRVMRESVVTAPALSRRRAPAAGSSVLTIRGGSARAASVLSSTRPAPAAACNSSTRQASDPAITALRVCPPVSAMSNLPGVQARRHAQPGAGAPQADVADRREDALHHPCGMRCAPRVIRAGVEDEEGVAGEFHDVTAVVGRRQQQREDSGERRDELFRPLPSSACEAFGEHRESRDVHEQGGAVHAEQARVRRRAQQQARHEGRGSDSPGHRTPKVNVNQEPSARETRYVYFLPADRVASPIDPAHVPSRLMKTGLMVGSR